MAKFEESPDRSHSEPPENLEAKRDSSPLTDSSQPSSPKVAKDTRVNPHSRCLPFSPERQRLAEQVRTLCSVYDKILKEEHPGDVQCELRRLSDILEVDSAFEDLVHSEADAGGIPPIAAPPHVPSCLICDFCGGDIFQSFFECRECREEPSAHGQKGENIVICPGCFIEGRSCLCKIMTPVQNYAIQLLLQAQNDACTSVNKELWKSPVKLIPLSHQ